MIAPPMVVHMKDVKLSQVGRINHDGTQKRQMKLSGRIKFYLQMPR